MEEAVKTEDGKTAPQRFLFNQSFDTERQAARKRKQEEEKPPEPTFSQAELDAARQAGYEDGRSAGLQEAGAGFEAATAELVQAIGGQLPAISEAQAASNDQLMHDGARVAVTIARKILPAYSAKNGTDELEALVSQCLQSLVDQPRIAVRVATSQVDPITQHLENAVSSSGFDGRFLIEADDEMDGSDCRLTWQGGGLERQESSIWREIDTAIAAYLGDEPTDDGATEPDPIDNPERAKDAAGSAPSDEQDTDVEQKVSATDEDGTSPAPDADSVDIQAESPEQTAGDNSAGEQPAGGADPLEDR